MGDDLRLLLPRSGVCLSRVGGEAVMFLPDRQIVVSVSEAVAELWPAIQPGITFERLKMLAGGLGVDGDELVDLLQSRGLAEPLRTGRRAVDIVAWETIDLAHARIGAGFSSPRTHLLLKDLFERAGASDRPCTDRIVVAERRSGIGFSVNGRQMRWSPWAQAGPALKIEMTDIALERVPDVVLHSAMVCRDEAMLLLGEPGAGKSTLAVALGASGFDLHADDMTTLAPDGTVTGIPLPSTVKDGSWPLIEAYVPGFADLPDFIRPDGKRVRYLPPPMRSGVDARRVRLVICLERDGRSETTLHPIPAREVMAELLKGAWSRNSVLSTAAFRSLATLADRAAGYRFRYRDLDGAVRALRTHWASLEERSRAC